MTVSRSGLQSVPSVAPHAHDADVASCLTPDDCFDYLEGRASKSEIESWRHHLDNCDSCRILVGEAARSALISSPSGSERALRTLAEGETVANRYRVVRFVARGGMGEVYEAFDEVLQQRIALKTLVLTAIDQEEAVARFLEEVRIARRVVHPNVCQIWEVGIHRWSAPREGAVPFLTMDFLSGETLGQRLMRVGRLQPAVAMSLFRELIAGLAAVHAAGIVHRDLKSDNVFLVEEANGGERVVVMDFGLARALERPLARFVSSGTRLLGTPAYMAPEQVEGGKVTQAADIYALGIVMFEALTGRVPFSGETAASMALSRLRQEAPKPSTLLPELGFAWDALLTCCLARDPRARFADANAVGAALDDLNPSSTTKRAPPAWRGLATKSMLMAGFVGLVGVAWSRTRAPAPPSPAPSTLATPTEAMVPVALPPTLPSAHLDPPTLAAAAAAASVPAQPSEALRSVKRAVKTTKPAPARPSTDAVALIDSAEELLAKGQIAEACATGERAVAANDSNPNAQVFLGRCYMRLGSPERARARYVRYLELAPSAPDADFVRAIIGSARQ